MADTFTLDTAGYVRFVGDLVDHLIFWEDLDPFTQGYTTEVLKAAGATRFDQLAPETLAAILKDCEAWRSAYADEWGPATKFGREDGGIFWRGRVTSDWSDFPPLTPYLGDDGKVYLREAGQ